MEHLFCECMNIERQKVTKDLAGGGTISYQNHLANIKCRFARKRGEFTISETGLKEMSTHRVFCSIVDVKKGDRLTRQSTNEQFYVLFINSPFDMTQKHHLELDVKLL